MRTIAKKLKEARKKLGLEQIDIAEKANINKVESFKVWKNETK